MGIGISVPIPAYGTDVAFIAQKAEDLGFESLWCADHPLIPVRTASQFPNSPDGSIPEAYAHFVDPFIALARASGATNRLKLGTGIALIVERNPLILAKQISTLDSFSGVDSRWASARAGFRRYRGLHRHRTGQRPHRGTDIKLGAPLHRPQSWPPPHPLLHLAPAPPTSTTHAASS